MTDATYLVLMATGRQGGATIQALHAKGCTNIIGTTRNPESDSAKTLVESGAVQKMLQADLGHPETLTKAIKESKATRVWFTTDWYALKKKTRYNEFLTGKAMVDAIKECQDQIQHVVYSSVGDANKVPETVEHFWSKADVEKYMQEQFSLTNTTWSVLRPVAFFDNMDDAKNYNPLTKGVIKFLTKEPVKVKFIATQDIGKGAAALLMDPAKYKGQRIEAAGGEHNGTELAQILTQVSGVPCHYKMALPRFVLWLLMPDLYHMVTWFEAKDGGYSADIDAFKKIVPDAMDAKAWFTSKGAWANGEKFGESNVAAGSSSSSVDSKLMVAGTAVALTAVAIGVWSRRSKV